MKKTITMLMVLALATVASAQTKPAAAPAQQASTDPIVIAAGDISIRQSEFEAAIKTLPQEYQQFAQGPGKKQFAEDFLRMKMLAAEGVKNGLDKDPEVVRQLALMRENLVANAQLGRIENLNLSGGEPFLRPEFGEICRQFIRQNKVRQIYVPTNGYFTDKTVKQITETLKKVQEAGFDEVILYFNVGLKPHAQVKDEMARFMTEVAPAFEGAHRQRAA